VLAGSCQRLPSERGAQLNAAAQRRRLSGGREFGGRKNVGDADVASRGGRAVAIARRRVLRDAFSRPGVAFVCGVPLLCPTLLLFIPRYEYYATVKDKVGTWGGPQSG
jgi:hypothetical protein